MKPKAQKTRKNIALKVAIIQRDITQREVARRTGIPEVRLSMFIRGCVAATEDEKRALAKVLRRGATALFPSIDQEEAVAS